MAVATHGPHLRMAVEMLGLLLPMAVEISASRKFQFQFFSRTSDV
jgi:hypothetical protein